MKFDQAPSSNPGPSEATSQPHTMDKAKAAVSSFLSRDGYSDTTVHEVVNPAIVNERITNTNHEEAQKIVDREVHQNHHHISIQPINDKEIMPEQHVHNMAGIENREINHGDEAGVKRRLEEETAAFRDSREVAETRRTTAIGPTVAGEHVHHHVHETIQPIIQRDIVQPSVVHTTYPVHEVHVNTPKHHTASALPAVSMTEFETQGGVLEGREERIDSFAGAPRALGDSQDNASGANTLGGPGAKGTTTLTGQEKTAGRGDGGGAAIPGKSGSGIPSSGEGIKQSTFSSSYADAATGASGSQNAGSSNINPKSNMPTTSSGPTAPTNLHQPENSILNHPGVGDHSGIKNPLSKKGINDSSTGNSASNASKGMNAGQGERKLSTIEQAKKTGSAVIDKLKPGKDSSGAGQPGFMK